MNKIDVDGEFGIYCIWREFRALKPLPIVIDTGRLVGHIVDPNLSIFHYKGLDNDAMEKDNVEDWRPPPRKWLKTS